MLTRSSFARLARLFASSAPCRVVRGCFGHLEDARGGAGAPFSPKRDRFGRPKRSIFARLGDRTARGTQTVRHAFRPVKMHTKRLSGEPQATRISSESRSGERSPRSVRQDCSKRVPRELSDVFFGRPGALRDCPGGSRASSGGVPERPGSALGVSRRVPRMPRMAPDAPGHLFERPSAIYTVKTVFVERPSAFCTVKTMLFDRPGRRKERFGTILRTIFEGSRFARLRATFSCLRSRAFRPHVRRTLARSLNETSRCAT